MAMPAPPMLGTREQSCLHRSCWEPENGRAHFTRVGDQRAGRPFVTDPTRHPTAGPVGENPRVSGQAQSAFCDGPELRHRQTRELIYKIVFY